MRSTIIPSFQGITRCIGSANERLCWNVMWLLIYWAHTQNDPCESLLLLVKQTCQKFTHNSVISPLAQWLKSDWQRNHKYNSSDLLQGNVLAVEILQSCTKPLIWCLSRLPFTASFVLVVSCLMWPSTMAWQACGNIWPGACFINDFLPAIQIWWRLRLAVIPLLAIRSQQIFAHATTAQLSCHVQNFVAITVLELRWVWNEISIEFELRWKNR